METWKFCGLALVAVIAFAVVRHMGRDFETPMKLTAAVFFGGLLITMAVPLVRWIRENLVGGSAERYADILLGALGIALMTGICADICRDCREPSIAGYVEMAGRLEILLLCLPLIAEILETVSGLLPA